MSVALAMSRGVPVPSVHDEFSYLLAGDTFAHGRLANPPHPLWRHFESFHVIQQPRCASKFPPGQGAFLAVGELLAGEPIVGVWLSIGLASAAIGWMLLAWLPPRWALIGALCAALRLAAGPWSDSYWGGAVAAIGGALLFGSVRRLAERPRWHTAMLLAFGLAILANSRPYEGLVVAVAAAVILVIAWWRTGLAARWSTWLSTACPLLIVLSPAACGMAIYNQAVTGDPFRIPYQVHDATYAACPMFLWQKPGPVPTYHHADMEQYYAHWERDRFLKKSEWFGFNSHYVTKLWVFGRFFVGPALLVPFVAATFLAGGFWIAAAWCVVGAALLAMSQTLYLHPHYLAPLTGLIWFLTIAGARAFASWKVRATRRPWIACALLLVAALAPTVGAMKRGPWRPRRSIVESQVAAEAGRQLVLVHLAADIDFHESWIYNVADVDRSHVVWARSLGQDADDRLLRYYADRRAWHLFVDRKSTKLVPSDRYHLPPPPHGELAARPPGIERGVTRQSAN